MYNIEKLKDDLIKMGVKKGDTLFIRADLGAIGKTKVKDRLDYINIFLDLVGDNGTIVGLSFSAGFFVIKNKNNIFNGKNKSYIGSFSNLMLNHPKSKRSMHPTNSYVAIGKYAEYILEDHNEESGAYDPVRKIVKLNAKMILIGCVETSPGFTTTHLAEVDLGYHKKIILPRLDGNYYKRNSETKLFMREDLGSCSSTFFKFYAYYVYKKQLKQGYIGKAYSILINAKDAYSIDLEVLKNNPKITLCNSKSCLLCRARRWDNLVDFPRFFIVYLIPRILRKVFSK